MSAAQLQQLEGLASPTGVSGILLQDPTDLDAFGDALRRLLEDPGYAARLGAAARERAIQLYLDARSLFRQAAMIQQIDDESPAAA